jgi:3-methylcrotonyl-CoA carboxylase alpha subunit
LNQFRRLLVANRGEIACRVMRTARRLGIETVAVYSDADRDALHVRSADRAVRIGPAPARESYLSIDAILAAAAQTDADAIHPGYGFLSENADFAAACAAAGRTFVGPSADAIRAMGSKIEAKRIVAAAGAPVVPGFHGEQNDARLAEEAGRIGYPVMIKASAGGGGKGMRRVDGAADFQAALAGARREAKSAFGDDAVLLEKYLHAPKHIEVQILADRHGRTLHLFERDCSFQRRHQKVVEEAPAPTVTPALRARMGAAAVAAAAAIDYTGAGTIEFICAGDAYYFMEMNTRLQVEHPVTEAILGLDLVEWQLRIAAGEPLPFAQEDLVFRGHAIEVRVYAEQPRREFLPSTGRLAHVRFPDDVRVDTGVETGAEITMHYDPMIAKVIAHAESREAARVRLDRALAATEIAGVEHNVAFLRRLLDDGAFRDGSYDTGMIDRRGDELLPVDDPRLDGVAARLFAARRASASPWQRGDAFRLNLPHRQLVRMKNGNDIRTVELLADAPDAGPRDEPRHTAVFDGDYLYVMAGGATLRVSEIGTDVDRTAAELPGDGRVKAPMPGQVIAVHVRVGERVRQNQPLLVLEAMKMEHTLLAPLAGVVQSVGCAVGERVVDGADLVEVVAAG